MSISVHFRIHREDLGSPILSFLSRKERPIVSKVSKAWHAAFRNFPRYIVNQLKRRTVRILTRKFVKSEVNRKTQLRRMGECSPEFAKEITDQLMVIAAVPTGENLLYQLSKSPGRIRALPN
jgi:hypothetical protein